MNFKGVDEMNEIKLSGEIVSGVLEEYKKNVNVLLKVDRKSGDSDYLNVIIPKSIYKEDLKYVDITGIITTKWRKDNTLSIAVYPFKVIKHSKPKHVNLVLIKGALCKNPIFRKTVFTGRFLTELVIAVNIGKDSYYIPTITFGKNAIKTSQLVVGNSIQAEARLQSRNYDKDGNNYRTTELCISKVLEVGD